VLEEPNPQIGSSRSQNPRTTRVIAHEEVHETIYKDERHFKKTFYDTSKMVKLFYNERTSMLQRESSNHPKGNGGDGKNPLFPPPPLRSPPSSLSSLSPSSPSSTPRHTPHISQKVHAKSPLLKLEVNIEFPM